MLHSRQPAKNKSARPWRYPIVTKPKDTPGKGLVSTKTIKKAETRLLSYIQECVIHVQT